MNSKNPKNTKRQNPDDEIYEIEVDDEFSNSVEKGFTEDNLNIKRLLFWILTGMVIAFLLVVIAYNMHGFNAFEFQQQENKQTKNIQIDQMKARENKILSTYGIENLKEGIYRIPIDSAISLYVKENQNKQGNSK